jgi:hypothetical protein
MHRWKKSIVEREFIGDSKESKKKGTKQRKKK